MFRYNQIKFLEGICYSFGEITVLNIKIVRRIKSESKEMVNFDVNCAVSLYDRMHTIWGWVR